MDKEGKPEDTGLVVDRQGGETGEEDLDLGGQEKTQVEDTGDQDQERQPEDVIGGGRVWTDLGESKDKKGEEWRVLGTKRKLFN